MTTTSLTASAADQGLSGLSGWVVSIMEALGAPGAGIAVALENLFPPIPSEIILPLAGFTASQGSFSLVEVILWTTLGSVVGALALYGLGAWLGRDRLYWIADHMPLMKKSDIERAEHWFDKHGKSTVFFGRLLPIFRSLISIPAGVERMNLLTFAALTLAGSAVWNTVLIVAGYLLGENWHVVEQYAGVLQYVVIGAVVVALVIMVTLRVRTNRREKHAGEEH